MVKGMSASKEQIQSRLGDPDSVEGEGIYLVWRYEPSPGDQQTRTSIWFNVEGGIANVARDIVR